MFEQVFVKICAGLAASRAKGGITIEI
jgi:hypothetical protein